MAALLYFLCLWCRRKGCRKLKATVDFQLHLLSSQPFYSVYHYYSYLTSVCLFTHYFSFILCPLDFYLVLFDLAVFFPYIHFLSFLLSLSFSLLPSFLPVTSLYHNHHHSLFSCLPWDSKRHLSARAPWAFVFQPCQKHLKLVSFWSFECCIVKKPSNLSSPLFISSFSATIIPPSPHLSLCPVSLP